MYLFIIFKFFINKNIFNKNIKNITTIRHLTKYLKLMKSNEI